MDFTKYDRITDVLLYLDSEITLTFVVVLSRKAISGDRKFYHYEIAKQSSYRGGGDLYNIKRNMNFFFTIDVKNDFTQNIILRPGDVYMLNDIISRSILPWYQADNPLYAYQIKDNGLYLNEYKPVLYTQSEVKYLQFEPCVLQDNNGIFNFGISINISGYYTVQMELDKFMSMVYLLHSDMYSCAASLCSYAKTEPYGVEVFRPYGLGGGRIDDGFTPPSNEEDIQASYTSTKINTAKNNSFLENSRSKKKG